MVERSWSDSQSTLTTELGSAVDHTDTPRRRCVVPKVRPRQRDGSDDQQVPEYCDQTVPVWSCKEARDRTKRKLKGDVDSVCRHGQNSRPFGGGAAGTTMVGRDTAVTRCGCSEVEREQSAGETPAAPASEVRSSYSRNANPVSIARVGHISALIWHDEASVRSLQSAMERVTSSLSYNLARTRCPSHCGMSFKTSFEHAMPP